MGTVINISGGSNDTNLVLNSASATLADGLNAADATTLSSHTTSIAANTSGLAAAVANVSANTSGLAAAVANVSANTSGLAAAVADVSANTSGLAAAVADVSANTSGLATTNTTLASVGNRVTNLETINLVTWGGAYAPAQKSTMVDTFNDKTWNDVKLSSGFMGLGPSNSMLGEERAANNVTTNVIETLASWYIPDALAGHMQSVNLAHFPAGSDGTPAYTLDSSGVIIDASSDFQGIPVITDGNSNKIKYSVPLILWGLHIVYNASDFSSNPAGEPSTAAHFFDTVNYPGKRCMPTWCEGFSQIALRADGVSKEDVNAILDTSAGIARVISKLDELSGNRVFYVMPDDGKIALDGGGLGGLAFFGVPPFNTPLEACSMGIFYTGRLYEPSGNTLHTNYKRIWDGWCIEYEYFTVPKASSNKDKTLDFLKHASLPAQTVALCKKLPYSPLRKSALNDLSNSVPDNSIYPHAHLDIGTPNDINYWSNSQNAVDLRNAYNAISGDGQGSNLVFTPAPFTHSLENPVV